MDNIYSHNREDVDRVIKLVDEYTKRLKELINSYRQQNRNRIVYLFALTVSLIVVWGISYIYIRRFVEYSLSDYFLILITILVIAISVLVSLYYIKGRRSGYDIKDEAYLLDKQLRQLIKIASQTREHIKDVESLALLEIDLKLTEAEDMIERSSRTFYFSHRRKETNANNV